MEIKIQLNNLDEALNSFNNERISSELDSYLIEELEKKAKKEKEIILQIEGITKKEEQAKLETAIHNYYKSKYSFGKKIDVFDDYFRGCFLIIGIILILISEQFKALVSELFLIAGWVVVWEIIYDTLFKDLVRKKKIQTYKLLANCKLKF